MIGSGLAAVNTDAPSSSRWRWSHKLVLGTLSIFILVLIALLGMYGKSEIENEVWVDRNSTTGEVEGRHYYYGYMVVLSVSLDIVSAWLYMGHIYKRARFSIFNSDTPIIWSLVFNVLFSGSRVMTFVFFLIGPPCWSTCHEQPDDNAWYGSTPLAAILVFEFMVLVGALVMGLAVCIGWFCQLKCQNYIRPREGQQETNCLCSCGVVEWCSGCCQDCDSYKVTLSQCFRSCKRGCLKEVCCPCRYVREFEEEKALRNRLMDEDMKREITRLIRDLDDDGAPLRATPPTTERRPISVASVDYKSLSDIQSRTLETVCAICQQDMQPTQKLLILTGCHHYFHEDCTRTLVATTDSRCPLCRQSM